MNGEQGMNGPGLESGNPLVVFFRGRKAGLVGFVDSQRVDALLVLASRHHQFFPRKRFGARVGIPHVVAVAPRQVGRERSEEKMQRVSDYDVVEKVCVERYGYHAIADACKSRNGVSFLER